MDIIEIKFYENRANGQSRGWEKLYSLILLLVTFLKLNSYIGQVGVFPRPTYSMSKAYFIIIHLPSKEDSAWG